MTNRVSTELATWWLGFSVAVVFTYAISGQTWAKPTATSKPGKAHAAVAQPTLQAAPTTAPDASIIGAPQIADEAMQLRQRLRGLADRLGPEPLLAEMEQKATGLRATTSEKAGETQAVIQSGATIAELQQALLDWQALSKRVTSLDETLTRQATTVEEEARSLRNDQTRWDRTYEQIKADRSPRELVDLTKKALDDIRAAVTLADEQRGRIIALQQAVTAQGSIVAGELESIRKAMTDSQRSLLEPDSPPLWQIQFRSQTDETVERLPRKSYAIDLTRLTNFLGAQRHALFGITLLTVAALAFFVRLNKTRRQGATGPADPGEVFHRPVSLALLVGLVATMPLLVEAPISAKGLEDLLAVVPVLRLLMPRAKAPFRNMLLALIASVLAWELSKFLQLRLWLTRDLLAVLSVTIVALFLWLVRTARRDNVPLQRGPALVIIAVHTGLLLIVISFFANIFGYFRLCDLLGNSTLVSAYRAVVLYTVFVVGTSIISFTLQTETARRLTSIRTGAGRIARRLSGALALITLFMWLYTALGLFAVRDDVYRAVHAAFNYQITIGTVSFAPGNIVVFGLILFFGYLIAAIIRVILGEEILPRLNLARGLPNAIATITHYVVLLLVFLLALAAAGVELSKFTILTGALGVGIGFGLQNVVNNFISGLILLFERPVRIGDSLEIGEVNGEVTKIGFRSSTLRTADGAALIIPNATLISQQVMNWTLSGTRRRVLVRVHVAYGNDPEQVRDLLLATVAGHPGVLEIPKPSALFLGFGESTLEFEVRFWAPRSEIAPELKSDVALRVAAALRDAGIKVPFPQGDMHLKTSEDAAKEVLAMPEKDER